MAWLEKKRGIYQIGFRLGDQKFRKSLKTDCETEANERTARAEQVLSLIDCGILTIPQDADVAKFVLSDGKLNGTPGPATTRCTLGRLCQEYLDSLPDGSLEATTLGTMNTHVGHLQRLMKKGSRVAEIGRSQLQSYVNRRAKEDGQRGNNVSPVTIKKELATLRAIWNWARQADLIQREFPSRGLKYPKTADKPRFQTRAEIESKLARSELSEDQQNELWSCLFLTLPEIAKLLKHAKTAARHPCVYAIICFAAHTGARRSEIVRSRIEDIDLTSRTATIREKKRQRGRLTTRSVPLSAKLCLVLDEWFTAHPGGEATFAFGEGDCWKNGRNRTDMTVSMMHDHLRRTLDGSKWDVVRGWHVFRHSFCSNCAAAGVDQRLINAWVGHQTEEMVRRYRHLIPDQQQKAMAKVFG